MKHYQITFQVPDDFVPEDLELNVTYKDEIEIVQEGEVSVESLLANQINLTNQKREDGDVFLFKYPDKMSPEFATAVKDYLAEALPDNTVIGLVDSIDLLVQNSDQAIEMLEQMINKVKTRSAILKK